MSQSCQLAGAVLLNAGRGPVIDNQALLNVLRQRSDLQVVLDVWEPEPDLDVALLPYIALATPHIAGYSHDGKVEGTAMIYRALCQFLAVPASQVAELSPQGMLQVTVNSGLTQAILAAYDIREDDARLRAAVNMEGGLAVQFDLLRKHYPKRREFHSWALSFEKSMSSKEKKSLSNTLATLGLPWIKGNREEKFIG